MSLPKIPLNTLGEPFYTGSVQRLYAIPGHDTHMVTETTNRGSVFDVGSIFDIPGSDIARAVFRHSLYSRMSSPELWRAVAESIRDADELDAGYRAHLMKGLLEELCQKGAPTHHAGMVDAETGEISVEGTPKNPSAFNVVRRFEIMKPELVDVLGAWLYDYSSFPKADGFVVPLEYIVRFGITSSSSVYKEYLAMNEASKKAYQSELGVSQPLEAWQYLEKPVSDCTTKFEPEDRNTPKQEALTLCGLNGPQFEKSMKLAVLGAWAVRHLLAKIGLLLWDIKWEFAKEADDLVFVDTIDSDSFRATRFLEHEGTQVVTHFNKQSMRDYYKIMHEDWLAGVNDAKKRAKSEGKPFTEILNEGQAAGTYPSTPDVTEEFLALQTKKMNLICDFMLGQKSAADVNSALGECGATEVNFYADAGKFEAFTKLNGV